MLYNNNILGKNNIIHLFIILSLDHIFPSFIQKLIY